jgi:hypothetical protein
LAAAASLMTAPGLSRHLLRCIDMTAVGGLADMPRTWPNRGY